MIEIPNNHCGNCGKNISCKVPDIQNCACSTIKLSPQTKSFLTKTYFDCLCNHCLEEINQKITGTANLSFPAKKEEFIEGVHYYREGNMWVFTELYHILKGSCCGNTCRHCVYGFKMRTEKPS